MFDWSFYKPTASTRPAWVPERTIFVTRHGSHAYGTSTPTSDLDLRGICIVPKDHYHGFLNAAPMVKPFGQATAKDPDLVVFELRKWFKLAAEANPNTLEIIFTDPSDHLLVTPIGEELLAHRDLFISKMAKHTFAGYAKSQLHRMKNHHEWHKRAMEKPTRAEFGLPEKPAIEKNQLDAALSQVVKKLDEWNLTGLENVEPAVRILLQEKMSEMLVEAKVSTDDLWLGAARTLGYTENFIALIGQEKRYKGALDEYHSYREWLRDRNPARAALEAKYGYDTKHGLHLVRLFRMCREILTEGVIRVRREDAQELLGIRNGDWTFDYIMEYAERENVALNELLKTCTLPDEPDYDRLDALCIRLVEASFR